MIKFYRIGALVLFISIFLVGIMPINWFETLTNKYILAGFGLTIGWLFTGIADILEKLERNEKNNY